MDCSGVLLYRYSPKPGPGSKTKARHIPWDDHRQYFLDPKNPGFFGPTHGMLRSSAMVALLSCVVRTICGSRTDGWSLPCVMSD
jgi:hypothetical protein